MKFTAEDVQTTTEEIRQEVSCLEVEHVRDAHFNITARHWGEQDFSKAREIGLTIGSIMPTYLGKNNGMAEWGIEIEVEWIGQHKIVMG